MLIVQHLTTKLQTIAILKDADLSTITTKTIRRTLETQTGTSLDPIKKEINAFIGDIFLNIQQQRSSPPVVSKTEDKSKVVKKTTPATIKKPVQRKKKELKEKRVIDWPLLKVSPPLSDIIHTNLVSIFYKNFGDFALLKYMNVVFTPSNSKENVGIYQRA